MSSWVPISNGRLSADECPLFALSRNSHFSLPGSPALCSIPATPPQNAAGQLQTTKVQLKKFSIVLQSCTLKSFGKKSPK